MERYKCPKCEKILTRVFVYEEKRARVSVGIIGSNFHREVWVKRGSTIGFALKRTHISMVDSFDIIVKDSSKYKEGTRVTRRDIVNDDDHYMLCCKVMKMRWKKNDGKK